MLTRSVCRPPRRASKPGRSISQSPNAPEDEDLHRSSQTRQLLATTTCRASRASDHSRCAGGSPLSPATPFLVRLLLFGSSSKEGALSLPLLPFSSPTLNAHGVKVVVTRWSVVCHMLRFCNATCAHTGALAVSPIVDLTPPLTPNPWSPLTRRSTNGRGRPARRGRRGHCVHRLRCHGPRPRSA